MSTNKPSKNIIIGCTGSVATIKLPLLIKLLLDSDSPYKFVIKIVITEHAKHFFDSKDIPLGIQIFNDDDEWKLWNKRGDPVLHIDLVKWADLLVIAPLDANSLSKIATGICDNLLLCTTRAWDLKKPLIFCPAMNTKMYEHPITLRQIHILKEFGYLEVPVIEKTLICGDTGLGAMADVQTIYQQIINCLLTPVPSVPVLSEPNEQMTAVTDSPLSSSNNCIVIPSTSNEYVLNEYNNLNYDGSSNSSSSSSSSSSNSSSSSTNSGNDNNIVAICNDDLQSEPLTIAQQQSSQTLITNHDDADHYMAD